MLFVLVDYQRILVKQVQGHILISFVLLDREYHLDQLQTLNLLSVACAQDLDVLEEPHDGIFDCLNLAKLFQLELS